MYLFLEWNNFQGLCETLLFLDFWTFVNNVTVLKRVFYVLKKDDVLIIKYCKHHFWISWEQKLTVLSGSTSIHIHMSRHRETIEEGGAAEATTRRITNRRMPRRPLCVLYRPGGMLDNVWFVSIVNSREEPSAISWLQGERKKKKKKKR